MISNDLWFVIRNFSLAFFGLGILSACDDRTSDVKASVITVQKPQTYKIFGHAKDILTGTNVVVKNNHNGERVVISAESNEFRFVTELNKGDTYDISIEKQPRQICQIEHGSGIMTDADITDVQLICRASKNKLNNFSEALMFYGGFTVPSGGRVDDFENSDPTNECVDQIGSLNELHILNNRIKQAHQDEGAFELKFNHNFPSNIETQAINLSLREFKACKQLGDEWRNVSYFPEVELLVNKSYSGLMALMKKLYEQKINYDDYVKKVSSIRARFDQKVKLVIVKIQQDQIPIQNAKEQALKKEQEDKKAEALRQPEVLKQQAEEKRLTELAQKEEELIMQAEVQRVKDVDLLKKQLLEQEKQFQPLHQRQQIERMR